VDVANDADFKLCDSTDELISTGNLVYSLFSSSVEAGSFALDFRLNPQNDGEESKSISGTGRYL
jgi:hypothetical protein